MTLQREWIHHFIGGPRCGETRQERGNLYPEIDLGFGAYRLLRGNNKPDWLVQMPSVAANKQVYYWEPLVGKKAA